MYKGDLCKPMWYGTQPVVIDPTIPVVQDTGKLMLQYRGVGAKHAGLLADANMSVDAPEECDCGYHSKRTGLIKSYTMYRGGHFEVKIDTKSAAHQTAVWFQSEHLELSAINIDNGMVWSAGYIFNSTHVISSKKASAAFDAMGEHVFSFTWSSKTDDLTVYVDGAMLYTLEGSEWNPMGMYQG